MEAVNGVNNRYIIANPLARRICIGAGIVLALGAAYALTAGALGMHHITLLPLSHHSTAWLIGGGVGAVAAAVMAIASSRLYRKEKQESQEEVVVIPESQYEELIAQAVLQRSRQSLTIRGLHDGVAKISSYARVFISDADITALIGVYPEEQKKQLLEWLKTFDKKRDGLISLGGLTQDIAKMALQIIQYGAQRDEFRKGKLEELLSNMSTNCIDAFAITTILLDIERQKSELESSPFFDVTKYGQFLKKAFTVHYIIETIARGRIQEIRRSEPSFHEDLEIQLAYLMELREDLDLPIGIKRMFFQDFQEGINCEMAKRLIKESYQGDQFHNFLLQHAKWREALAPESGDLEHVKSASIQKTRDINLV